MTLVPGNMSYKLRSRKSTSDTLDNAKRSTLSNRLAAPDRPLESLIKPVDENCENSDYLGKLLKVYEDHVQMLKHEMNRNEDIIIDILQIIDLTEIRPQTAIIFASGKTT